MRIKQKADKIKVMSNDTAFEKSTGNTNKFDEIAEKSLELSPSVSLMSRYRDKTWKIGSIYQKSSAILNPLLQILKN